jgi:ATP-binding cassette subfamily B protein
MTAESTAPDAPQVSDDSEPASAAAARPARSLGPLRMIWKLTLGYPKQILIAFLALLTTSSATIAIPARFKAIIDQATC